MQALNTSGILELMENLGAAGECQVPFGQRYKYFGCFQFQNINLTSGSFVESTSKLLQDKR